MCQDIDPTISARRGDPRHVVAHRTECGNKILKSYGIIREAMSTREGKISEDHARPGMKIWAFVVLNSPGCLFQCLVDILAH